MTSATERALIELATLHPIMTSARPLDETLWSIMKKPTATWTQEEAAYVAQREREG